jgi:hypothetical protein
MGIRRWLGTIEPFRLIGDSAAMIIIEEGGDAEESLRRKIRDSDSLLGKLALRVVLLELRRQQRKNLMAEDPSSRTGQLAASDPAESTLDPGDVRRTG